MSGDEAERWGVLLSIRPRYTDAILAHTKTVELRRSRIGGSPGTPVLLYSSSPVKAVVGVASIARIDEDLPGQLWESLGALSGVTRDEFDAYFDGAATGFGLHLTGVHPMRQPISLEMLRAMQLDPPQSFRYVTRDQHDRLAVDAALGPGTLETDARSWAVRLLRAAAAIMSRKGTTEYEDAT